MSIFSLVLLSHNRQLSGEISSARTMRISSFSHNRPNSILKSTSVMPTPRNSPVRKSLIRKVNATISSMSWVAAQPKQVMCSSETIGSPSVSFL